AGSEGFLGMVLLESYPLIGWVHGSLDSNDDLSLWMILFEERECFTRSFQWIHSAYLGLERTSIDELGYMIECSGVELGRDIDGACAELCHQLLIRRILDHRRHHPTLFQHCE